MGLDACIWFKLKPGVTLEDVMSTIRLPDGWTAASIHKNDSWVHEHVPGWRWLVEVDCYAERYFSEGYQRGSWERIGGVLAQILAHSSITAVWYASDGPNPDDVLMGPPFTLEDFNRLDMAHAEALREGLK